MGKNKKKQRAAMLKNIDTETDPESMWENVGNLGEGSFGMVQKVEHKQTKKFAAAKVIPVKYEEELEDFVVEVDILTECKHPAIVQLVGAHLYKNQLWVLLELCEGGAVDDVLIELETGIAEPAIRSITNQLNEGLICLHANGIIHRDLKAGNILLKADGTVKLTDFGVSAKNRKLTDKRDTFIGTPYWMAPEVVLCENSKDKPYDYSSDMWSFGITLIELAETSPPYSDMHPMRVLFKIPKADPPTLTEQSKWHPDFHSFLADCLKKAPGDRMTAKAAAGHRFIKGKSDKAPVRDLYRLFNADVTEVVEDLPAQKAQQMAQQSSVAAAAGGGGASSSSVVDGAANMAKELNAASLSTPAVSSDPGKSFKTLTKTRQYVNEAGEIVEISTKRVVETGVQSGKLMTIRPGMTNVDKDWKDAEAKKFALLRKSQLKEIKLIQREEQKECNELISKLKAERDTCDTKQRAESDSFDKEALKNSSSQQKVGASEKAKQEKAIAAELIKLDAAVKANMESQLKAFKATKAKDLKAFLKELDSSTPKAERKAEWKRNKDAAMEKVKAEELALVQQLELEVKGQLKANKTSTQDKRRKTEEALLMAEQTLIRNTEKERIEMVERHLKEKQQMLQHQLKATFWMQKHQMHYRHEKECDQLNKIQAKKVAGTAKKFSTDQKTLPRKQKVAASEKKKELKKRLTKDERPAKLSEFQTDEARRIKAEVQAMSQNYAEITEQMKATMAQETDELKEMQATKKQLLVANENAKLMELDQAQSDELGTFRAERDAKLHQLEESLELQMQTHRNFYDGGDA